MPRRNLSVLSKDEDPYRLQRYPVAFQVMLSNGKQAHNARELVKAAKFKGQWLDMARQPIPAAKVREILALTGQRPHANTGRFMPASQLAKLRKLAKRELLARQGKAVVGPMQYRATAPRPTAPRKRRGGFVYFPDHLERIRAIAGGDFILARSTRSNGLARPYASTNAATYGDLRAMTDEQLMEEVMDPFSRRGSYPSSRR